MQGHVYMDVTQLEDEEQTKISVDCELKDVGTFDKFKLFQGLCKALQVSKQEYMCFMVLLGGEV